MKKIFLILFSIINCFASICQTDYFKDGRDGKVYKTVKIGEQTWMAENLNSDYYYDGTPVELITSNEIWSESLFGYSYYDFKETIQKENGNLYKYFTAMDVCPFNWHLPTNSEWDKMLFELGKNKTDYHFKNRQEEIFLAGNDIKIKDPTLWQFWERKDGEVFESNQEITNRSNFSALPSGYRYSDGSFLNLGEDVSFWSVDSDLNFSNDNSGLSIYSLIFLGDRVRKKTDPDYLMWGLPVRCVKDDLNSNLTKVHDSLNKFSFSNQSWNTITTQNHVVSYNSLQLRKIESSQVVIDAFKQKIFNFDENSTYISPLSKNRKYFSLISSNEDQPCTYFFDLDKLTFMELDLCNQNLWSSYSPNQNYVLYKTAPERLSDHLTVYDIQKNNLNSIDFYKQGFTQNTVGYIAPYEILRLDGRSLNWINQFEFEIIADIYSEIEDFEAAKIEEIPATELRDDSKSATYIYTYNINLKKVVKAKIIKT